MIATVTKTNGQIEAFDINKLSKWADYAHTLAIDWSMIVDEAASQATDGISTSKWHRLLIDACLLRESLPYSRMAAILERAKIKKHLSQHDIIDQTPFSEIRRTLINLKVWDSAWVIQGDTAFETQLNACYRQLENHDLAYWRIKQFNDKYALKYQDLAIETPAIGMLGLALAIYGNTQAALDLATAIIEGKASLPTPVLNGCRNGDWDCISCCIIDAQDTAHSIGVAQHIAYSMTAKKAGIGIHFNTRSEQDNVKGGRIKHLGKQPIYATLDRAVKMFSQVTRGGSATVTYKCIDPDIESLLLLRSQRCAKDRRLDHLDYSFAYNDAFAEAVIADQDWYLFSLADAPDIHRQFHKDAKTYNALVDQTLTNDPNIRYKTIKARKLLLLYLTVRFETGRVYDINLTRTNTHTPFNDVIHQSNLCVAPETLVLTKTGYEYIEDMAGTKNTIWNGSQWSNVYVQRTGINKPTLTVKASNGLSVTCTKDHQFIIQDPKTHTTRHVPACELKAGDQLLTTDYPVIDGRIVISNAYIKGKYASRNYTTNMNRVQSEIWPRYTTPTCVHDIASRISWLAGYFDSDAVMLRENTAYTLTWSTSQCFLLDVLRMLHTLGASGKVVKKVTGSFQKQIFTDEPTDCTVYRLVIDKFSMYRLQLLGLNSNRYQLDTISPDTMGFPPVYVDTVSTEDVCDTYCFNEPIRNTAIFDGLLTGQCMEIALPTKGYTDMPDLYNYTSHGETAFCMLAAINQARVSDQEYGHLANLLVGMLDILLDRAPPMTPSMGQDLQRRRSLGIGMIGLAEYLYEKQCDYDGTERSLDAVHYAAERHYYHLLKASQSLAHRGAVEGIDTNWLPIDTRVGTRPLHFDWEPLRGIPRRHSVLVAHMPSESSAVFTGATNGLYPVRDQVVDKQSHTGRVQYIAPQGQYRSAYDVDNMTLSYYYGVIQDFTDQALSADYYYSKAHYSNGKKPMSEAMKEWVVHYKLGIKTKYYLNTDDTVKEVCESCSVTDT